MNLRVLGISSVVSALAVGGVVGYFVAKHQLEKEYEKRITQELEDAKRVYKTLYKKDEFETPESAAEVLGVHEPVHLVEERALVGNAARSFVQYGGKPVVDEAIVENIFTKQIKHEDPSPEELRNRTEEAPYVISLTEFQVNEPEYDQVTCTYYAGDDQLVDDREEPVADPDDLVGIDNLLKFGHLSGDPRVVYVQNDAKSLQIEINRSEITYAEAAGLT